MPKVKEKSTELANRVQDDSYMSMSNVEWRYVLAREVQVYVCNDAYLAKRYDQINYQFCDVKTATTIIKDNLYAILRYKYFTKLDDEIDRKINDIVNSFCINLKSSLIRVDFDDDTLFNKLSFLPDGCIAFRNGVYNFKKNDWLFKYNIVDIKLLCNKIYIYDPQYAIMWYINLDFEPLPIDINKISLEEFIEYIKMYNDDCENYCFELMWNIAHDIRDKFSISKFQHLCEVMGYTCLNSFSQNFIMLVGSGQNGKNSLFDGCFTYKLKPTPSGIDMETLETDQFVTGALENKSLNIFLETSAKTHTESKMLKAITGSMYQTIHNKGENKRSGLINCKFIFSANDQDKLKFSDTTNGFRRRINIYEVYYKWDADKRFMRLGDYYDTTFSDSLYELKSDTMNVIIFIYFAMYGIKFATNNYTKNFKFTYNDWRLSYTDIDFDMKEAVDKITLAKIVSFMNNNMEFSKVLFYDMNKVQLSSSETIKAYGFNNQVELIKMLCSDEDSTAYFSDYDVLMSLKGLQMLLNNNETPAAFTSHVKKVFNISRTENCYHNKAYIKVTFRNGRLKIYGDD